MKPPAVRRQTINFSDLNRQNQHDATVVVEPALQFKNRVVVQPARNHALVLEHELAGKELRLRKFFRDNIAQLGRLLHDVRAQRDMRLGVKTAFAHVSDKPPSFVLRVIAQVFHLVGTLEISGVQHANLHKDEVLINLWEHSYDGEQRMQAEAVETIDKEYGGASVGVARRRCFFLDDGVIRKRGGDEFVKSVEFFLRLLVMAFHPERDPDQRAGDEQRGPAAFVEFHHAERECRR